MNDKVPRPHEMGERWLGEAETERGLRPTKSPSPSASRPPLPRLQRGRGTQASRRWRDSTPLWPAGHLPRKGGDWQLSRPNLTPPTR
ncbi:hypothetical protein EN809_027130 [Mesorhizobium sp. M2E.F.Ca.ET.166.01.1.1]|nr:hypothetical protein EN862_015860 [Mesorhizobium sp. M2E.F.Ca.ET.219.01.1.1]TGT68181.1 hypothetical protein EN809_027130 [Mesorhizobium sp. M2E.F.Ca.ET.166.01.1.1]TGW01185.1 hypothetical protein EN797_012440 [Mesorhizobium sp. M2E.F.Ca.ET.154.01.1.1]